FFVTVMTNQQNIAVLTGETLRFLMNLRHQRAGSVNSFQLAVCRFGMHSRGDSVSGENNSFPFGNLISLVDENRSPFGEGFDNKFIVDDLLTYVDRWPVMLQSLFNGYDSSIHTGTVAAWRGKKNPLTHCIGHILMICRISLAG